MSVQTLGSRIEMSRSDEMSLKRSEQCRHEALDLLKRARKQRELGNLAAEQLMKSVWNALNEALTFCSLNHRARFLKASCAMEAKDYALAKKEVQVIHDQLSVEELRNMDNSLLHLTTVEACKLLGQTDDALRYAREAVQLYPKDPHTYMVVGELCDKTGQIAQAVYMCRMAVQENKSDDCGHKLSDLDVYRTLCCLGSNLMRQGEIREAEVILTRAMRIDECLPTAFVHLSDLLSRSGRNNDALAMVKRAAKLDGNDRTLQLRISRLEQLGAETPLESSGRSARPGLGSLAVKSARSSTLPSNIVAGEKDDVKAVSNDKSQCSTGAPSDECSMVVPAQVVVPYKPRRAEQRRNDDWFACCFERS